MPLLQGLRSLITRKREPVVIDISESASDTKATTGPGPARDEPRPITAAIEAKPVGRRSIADLQRGYDQVMDLARKINDHLDQQADRHDRWQNILERMPGALGVLPEINRQNARLLDVITEYLDHSRQRERTLNDTLSRISESSGHQTEVLELLREQLDVNNQTARHLTNTLSGFRQTLTDLGHSNTQAVQVLSELSASAQARESKLEMVIGRSQKWMIAALFVCGFGCVIALVVAIMTLVQLNASG